MENKSFYILYHSYEDEFENFEQKILGYYSSREKAFDAINKFKKLEGFKDFLDGFYIEESFLNKDNKSWTEGFSHEVWRELEGVPYFTEDILKEDIRIVIKKYYNLENIPEGPGSEFKKLLYWKEENEK